MTGPRRATLVLGLALAGLGDVRAEIPAGPTPFHLVGYIRSLTLDDPGDPLSGGSMTVNGVTVVIPKNTIVTMPASALSMTDLFKMAPFPYGVGPGGNGQSGLALSDTPTPLASYEADLLGNRLGDVYVAGLVHVSQELLGSIQGYVSCIDYARGDLRVGGTTADCTTGARVRLADPGGRHGRASSHDPRFASDRENPSIRAITGYPMCLPRTDPAAADDPLCPQSNRLRDFSGGFLTHFIMGLQGDASQQAPFEVGDHVTVSGALAQDDLGLYTEAWTVVADLQISTRAGVDPAYLSIDELVFGTGGAPLPGIAQDAVLQMTMEGFTTDPTRLVDAYAVDVDACNGAEAERLIATMNPAGQLVPNFYATTVNTTSYLPLFREVRARIRGATSTTSANGFSNGTYRAPVGHYIFPVNLIPGDPLVPLNLQDLPFLARGSGPWNGGPVAGQLDPFPYSPAPAPVDCSGGSAPPPPAVRVFPFAHAGADFTVQSGAVGTLDGSASSDPAGGSLTYNWIQTSGPTVLLSNPGLVTPTFDAPPLPPGSSPALLGFVLLVTNSSASANASVTVTVVPATAPTSSPPSAPEPLASAAPPSGDPGPSSGPPAGASGGCGTAAGASTPGALLALAALLRRRRR